MRDHAPELERHEVTSCSAGHHLRHGAGMILAFVGWCLFVAGIFVGLWLSGWVF